MTQNGDYCDLTMKQSICQMLYNEDSQQDVNPKKGKTYIVSVRQDIKLQVCPAGQGFDLSFAERFVHLGKADEVLHHPVLTLLGPQFEREVV